MIRRAYLVFKSWYNLNTSEEHDEWARESAVRLGDIMQNCSCMWCGNPRRHFSEESEKLTWREKKFLIGMREQIDDFLNDGKNSQRTVFPGVYKLD